MWVRELWHKKFVLAWADLKKKKMFLVKHSGSFLFLIYLVSNPVSVGVTQISGTILAG